MKHISHLHYFNHQKFELSIQVILVLYPSYFHICVAWKLHCENFPQSSMLACCWFGLRSSTAVSSLVWRQKPEPNLNSEQPISAQDSLNNWEFYPGGLEFSYLPRIHKSLGPPPPRLAAIGNFCRHYKEWWLVAHGIYCVRGWLVVRRKGQKGVVVFFWVYNWGTNNKVVLYLWILGK